MKVYFLMFGFFFVCRMAGASHQGYVIPTIRGRVGDVKNPNGFYFPVSIRLMPWSLLRASMGVRLLMSRPRISSRI